MIPSYPKIYSFGRPEVSTILEDPVWVQEKVDGSQISFRKTDSEIQFRSKGQPLVGEFDKMFKAGVDAISEIGDQLIKNYIYRGEYLARPKHNTLAYDRTPSRHVILFDVQDELGRFLSPLTAKTEAERLGLEYVSTNLEEKLTLDKLVAYLNTVSSLGGAKYEGVVVKNYAKAAGPFADVMMAKHVSEEFKEVHRDDWRERNPTKGDIIAFLCEKYRSQARWLKAVQHLREAGKLDCSPKDIGPLMKEVSVDVLTECEDEIKKTLFDHAWKIISRSVTKGLPEWYKNKLLESTFNEANNQTEEA